MIRRNGWQSAGWVELDREDDNFEIQTECPVCYETIFVDQDFKNIHMERNRRRESCSMTNPKSGTDDQSRLYEMSFDDLKRELARRDKLRRQTEIDAEFAEALFTSPPPAKDVDAIEWVGRQMGFLK